MPVDKGRYRINPDSDLPLSVLLKERRISLSDVARRCGYTNLSKGLRRLQHLAEGDLKHYVSMRSGLAVALDIALTDLDAVADDTRYILRARRDREYRSTFEPHVVWNTEHTIPSPITIAGLIDARRLLFWFPQTDDPARICDEAVAALPIGISCYGKTVGFFVNYTPDNAVSFNCAGDFLTLLPSAVVPGHSVVSVG